ncbi:MAG: PAS domain-containing protein [Gammaproteobacteria bacterium]|nr:PAS domain-containing protein [Gammaproteobacteria bacterium]
MDDKQTIRVLHLEDTRMDQILIRSYLQNSVLHNYIVTTMDNLKDACADTADYEVMLVDLSLVDSDGMETIQRLRARFKHRPMVVLTAADSEAIGVEAINTGAQDYLIKSAVSPDLLSRVLVSAIGRKRSEDELVISQERLGYAMQGSGDGVIDWNLITNATYHSRPWQILLGYAEGEMGNAYEDWLNSVNEQDRPLVAERLQGHLEGRLPSYEVDFRMKHKNGSVVWMSVRGRVVEYTEDNKPARLVGVHSEITERKEHEQIYKTLYEVTTDPNFTTDEKIQKIIEQACLFMNTPIAVVGKVTGTIYEVVYALTEDGVKIGDRRNLEDTYNYNTLKDNDIKMYHNVAETEIADKPCYKKFPFNTYLASPLIVNEKRYGTLGFFDVKARNRPFNAEEKNFVRMVTQWIGHHLSHQEFLAAQKSLEQSQKLESIGQLAAGVAHEINTPIQFVGDNIQFLRDGITDVQKLLSVYDDLMGSSNQDFVSNSFSNAVVETKKKIDLEYLLEEMPKAAEQALEGVSRVSEIVKAMKQFSHPGSGEKEFVDLNQCIENTIVVSRNEWKYVADLETHLDPALPKVKCFPGEFNQTILNMIVNAAHAVSDVNKATGRERGTITITTHALDAEYIEVLVVDTGAGISADNLTKVFDPFFTTKEVGKGTGQGLAIAYSVIVDKHAGRLSVESVVGQGTTFHIVLPINSADPIEK